MLRERRLPPPDIFPPEPWALGGVHFDPALSRDFAGQAETMFALSNGYLGIRGTPDEGRPLQEGDVIAVTIEPDGGSPEPTTDPMMTARL